MNRTSARLNALRLASVVLLAAGVALAYGPEASGWGGRDGGFGGGGGGGGFHGFGGGGGGGGGGFHGFGGDGFGGGTMDHSYSGSSSWQHPSNYGSSQHSNGQADYNTYNANQTAKQQANFNEANTLQENQEHSEEAMHTNTLNTVNANVGQTNWNGGNPYGGCCSDGDGGSNTGEVLGAAALGAVGGMAVGSMMASAAQAPSTTVIETAPPYGYAPPLGTTLYALPPGAYSTTVNGSTYYVAGSTYYKSYFNGSQVVYVATNPY